MSNAIIKKIENFLHGLVNEIDTVIEPGLEYLKANVPAEAVTIGEGILSAAATGAPWATLLASLVSQAETAGIKLAEDAAKVALNTAQNNIIAKAAA